MRKDQRRRDRGEELESDLMSSLLAAAMVVMGRERTMYRRGWAVGVDMVVLIVVNLGVFVVDDDVS